MTEKQTGDPIFGTYQKGLLMKFNIFKSPRDFTGEQLLLLTVMGNHRLVPAIQRELDRRAARQAALSPLSTPADLSHTILGLQHTERNA